MALLLITFESEQRPPPGGFSGPTLPLHLPPPPSPPSPRRSRYLTLEKSPEIHGWTADDYEVGVKGKTAELGPRFAETTSFQEIAVNMNKGGRRRGGQA